VIAVTGTNTVTTTPIAYGTIETDTIVSERLINSGQTEDIVRDYFSDIPVMVQVARCESTFRHTMEDGSVLQGRVDSDDTGVMQINTRYHGERAVELGLDLENIYDNMEYARYLYDTQGTQPWSASRPCWGNTLAYNG